mgnify:CR=1 FL=1
MLWVEWCWGGSGVGEMMVALRGWLSKGEGLCTGEPMLQWGREKPYGLSLWWPVVARNKKSVTANLRTEEGQDLVRRLVARADVVVEHFRPGTLERWGLSPEQLWERNTQLVITRVTGFWQTGPATGRAG